MTKDSAKEAKQTSSSEEESKTETVIKKRGRRIKYQTDEERIEARRRQQKAYRERKRNELLKLKELFEKENGLKESSSLIEAK